MKRHMPTNVSCSSSLDKLLAYLQCHFISSAWLGALGCCPSDKSSLCWKQKALLEKRRNLWNVCL